MSATLSRRARLLACTTLLLLAAASSARAWSRDPLSPTLVLPGTSVSQSVYGALPDGSGGCFVLIGQYASGAYHPCVQHLTSTGAVAAGWPAAGVLCTNTATAANYISWTLDGSGGVLVAWTENRTGHQDIYAQHVTSNGSFAAGWSASGLLIYAGGVEKQSLAVCSDGAGGMLIAFEYVFSGTDHDIYVSRVTGAGAVNSIGLATSIAYQSIPVIAADGSGGSFVLWQEGPSGSVDVRGARLVSGLVIQLTNISMTSASGDQLYPQVMSDNAGGAWAAWSDYNPGYSNPPHLFTAHLGTNGVPEAYYSPYGQLVTDSSTLLYSWQMVSDGGSGAFFAWFYGTGSSPDYGVHFAPHGQVYPGWAYPGMIVASSGASAPGYPSVGADGSGGAFFAFTRGGYGSTLYANHWNAYGSLFPTCSTFGRAIGPGPYALSDVRLVPDGNGGAICVCDQYQSGLGTYIAFAIHLDTYAMLGDNRPASAGVKDILADQGGQVRFTWNASPYDNPQEQGIGSYWVWRQAPITLAQAAVTSGSGAWLGEGASLVRASNSAAGGTPTRLFRRDAALSAAGYAWEYLTSMPAHQAAQYSYVSSTTSDSIAGHNPYTVFMVEAHAAADEGAFWASAPDSGYSVDNLPPVAPAPFTAQYVGGTTALHWGRNVESDLSGYRLYRGNSLGFTPSPANLVSAQPDTGYVDPAGGPYVYKLTAVDAHGNESPAAVVTPSGALAVDGAAPHALALELASTNPSRDGATLRFALPKAGSVRVAVYDAAGREVRMLARGDWPAGEWHVRWDGAADGGERMPSGLYFARLTAGGRELVRRIVLAR